MAVEFPVHFFDSVSAPAADRDLTANLDRELAMVLCQKVFAHLTTTFVLPVLQQYLMKFGYKTSPQNAPPKKQTVTARTANSQPLFRRKKASESYKRQNINHRNTNITKQRTENDCKIRIKKNKGKYKTRQTPLTHTRGTKTKKTNACKETKQ